MNRSVNMKRSLLALSIIALSFSANADNRKGWYLGGGAASINSGLRLGDNSAEGSMKFVALEVNGGYKFSNILGVDARIATGLAGDERFVNETINEFSILHYESIYYRPELVNEIAKFYGLFGATNMSFKNNTSGNTVSETGFSWGAGVGFVIGLHSNLNFEYRNLLTNDDRDVNSFGMTYDYRF